MKGVNMKLRNKKTGEVKDFSVYGDIVWLGNYRYNSLAELNEEWEDYIPKEPLVSAKEIREEIKLFSYRNEIACFRYQARNGALYNEASNGAVISLEVIDIREVELLVDGCLYTIDYLCGDEE